MRRLLVLMLPLAALGGLLPGHGTRPESFTPVHAPEPAASPAAPVSDDWLASARRDLERREYEASENGRGLQAPNRAHDLRTYFEPAGVRVLGRTTPADAALLELRVSRIGRAGALAAAEPGEVLAAGARVEIMRTDWREWFVNSDAGLEQGFTLERQPAGQGPVIVELTIEGATARPAPGGAVFAAAGGRRLRYGKLAAFDARGVALAATMEVESGRVQLRVEDGDAAYPVTIDPLLTNVAETRLDGQQANAGFGRAVGGAGDVNGDGYADVLVGAQGYDAGELNEGVAFLYYGGPGGIPNNATPSATIQSNQAGAGLGFSVTSAGDVNGDGYGDVVVCDYGYNWGGNLVGAAFVFHGGPGGINPNSSPANANATLKSDQTFTNFALSASSAGDINGDGYGDLIVGSDNYNTNTGGAFIFHGSAAGLVGTTPASAATKLVCTQASSSFGYSVAGAGDVNGDGYSDVVVGAWRYDQGQTDEGAAFVYLGNPAGIPTVTQASASARIETNVAGGQIGYSVAGAGDVNGDGYADIVLGAPGFSNGLASEGAGFVVLGSAAGIPAGGATSVSNGWIEGNQANALFGYSVQGAGDVNGDGYSDVIVGADLWDNGEADEGGAFVLYGSPTGIAPNLGPTSAGVSVLQGNQANADYGVAVAGAGDVDGDGYDDVIVGAVDYDGGAIDEGSAFIYRGGARGMVGPFDSAASLSIFGTQQGAGYGNCVAGAGDVNGDGYPDLIIGAPQGDFGATDGGAAYLYLGQVNGGATLGAILTMDQDGAWFGGSVASAGDVNGDGYGDVIVGARHYDDTEVDEGAAFLYLGSASGIADGGPATASARITGGMADAALGVSVASAGDVNGDGFPDLIVGAQSYSSGQSREGCAFIFHGGASGISSGDATSADMRLESDQAFSNFGASVAGAGDVNGDGYADVIVGAPWWNSATLANVGSAYIFHGGPSGIADGHAPNAPTTLQSDEGFSDFGLSVASAGDVNRDGYADVIVGSPQWGPNGEGAWYVFHGSATGVPSAIGPEAETFLTGSLGFNLGRSVAGIGDVNGDGYADVAIGAPMSGGTGLLLVYVGSATGIVDNSAQAVIQSLAPTGQLGMSVAAAGDRNLDGYADVVVGVPGDGNGRFSTFHGGGNLARRGSRVYTTPAGGGATFVHPWNLSGSPDGFRVNAELVHPGGRGRVKLEVEHCPPGVPFGSGSCTREVTTDWVEAAAPGTPVALTHDVSPAGGSLRRWRARTLRAPFTVTAAGITPPPNPAHGPWFRPVAQSIEADVRTPMPVTAVETSPAGRGGLAIERLVNPSRGAVNFTAVLPGTGRASAELFDIAGRRLAGREWQPAGAGREAVRWSEAPRLRAGVYLLRLTQSGKSITTNVVVVR